ncbi:glycosyltransferase family 2 protein [Allorhizobium undicola]|uniref:glycosyltransferase family 2 protein n=1 Tax=Allorhizobium undicola TaxID=78527 RepID=UPI001FD9C783|nr:glycosyltransferase family 2 protein [Allorhizobium undicola]
MRARATARSVAVELEHMGRIGVSHSLRIRLARMALCNGTGLEQELLVSGEMDEDEYYAAFAAALGLPYLPSLPHEQIFYSDKLEIQLQTPRMVRLYPPASPPVTVLVPEACRLAELEDQLRRFPSLRQSMAITSPGALRRAVWKIGSLRRAEEASNSLFNHAPAYSARQVVTGPQGFWAGMALSSLAGGLVISASVFLPLLHVVLSTAYLSMLALRAATLVHQSRRRTQRPDPLPHAPLPVYTVLVAMYREKSVVPQLVDALKRLDWPPSLLDVKLACEADDDETLEALEKLSLPPWFEIVRVPAIGPRTKPKALNYALAGARGTFLVIYDAEDRPHPGQLKEAYARFSNCPDEIACLQAPLIIANGEESWISSLFALEYAALFRGLLPMLARLHMPLPLGGTSNHFRTDILRRIGGWDPYNVTEDADLGLRLYRAGYRCQTLRCQTLEDAPISARIWIGQRSRWFKGWLQTWLIMMRHPLRTCRDMGLRAFFMFQLMIGGMLLSSLFHPAILIFFATNLCVMLQPASTPLPWRDVIMFWVDMTNILGSYAIFMTLGRGAMTGHERKKLGLRYFAIPFYWLMTSYSAWKAALELRTKPFFWNKTPHRARPRPPIAEPLRTAQATGAEERLRLLLQEPPPEKTEAI